jgi:hypothetical protein
MYYLHGKSLLTAELIAPGNLHADPISQRTENFKQKNNENSQGQIMITQYAFVIYDF